MNASFLELDSAINDACAPIFSLLSGLMDPDKVDKLPDDLRVFVEALFETMERRFFEIQLSVATVHDVKFAMAAYADEMVMSSRWEGKYQWMSQPLVVHYFGDTNAGVSFFNRLEALRSSFEDNIAAIQLYYSAIQFGFQGIYRIEGYEKLQSISVKLQVELDHHIGTVERNLADDSAPENTLAYHLVGKQPYWVMVTVTAAICLLSILIYGEKTQESISASAQSISVLHAPHSLTVESYLKD